MLQTNFLLLLGAALFFIGLAGIIIKRNLLIILMFAELMLNALILLICVISQQMNSPHGNILSFLIYVIAAAEIALAIPILLQMTKQKRSLNADEYANLKG